MVVQSYSGKKRLTHKRTEVACTKATSTIHAHQDCSGLYTNTATHSTPTIHAHQDCSGLYTNTATHTMPTSHTHKDKDGQSTHTKTVTWDVLKDTSAINA